MRYIITESQYHSLQVRRRMKEIKDLIENLYPYQYPCDYEDFDSFLFSLVYGIKHELSLDWIDNDKFQYIEKLIRGFLKDELLEYYNSMCNQRPS